MALTQVRAKLGEEWVILTYNETTGRYDGYLTATGTSYHQPGGYFPVTVEASNEAGETTSIDGDALPALRLVVRETAAPTLELVSPPQGYVTTANPTFVFEAQDEEGGSGIDPDSAQATVDGVSVPCTSTEGDGVYTITFDGEELSEGPHTVTAAISDYDGNETTASAAYIVDTVPPVLVLKEPNQRHVTDDDSVLVTAEVWDATSGAESVTVGGADITTTVPGTPMGDGSRAEKFSAVVPLEIGENHISVSAADAAGNVTTTEVYMIRLVTDRTQADVERLLGLYKNYDSFDDWPEEEQTWFLQAACLRGSYDVNDWNRVGAAVRLLGGELQSRGYATGIQEKTDWDENDAPTRGQMETYRQNVVKIRNAQKLPYLNTLPLPATMRNSNYQDWNNLEKALVEADTVFPRYSYWTCGEITCGEF